jgi:ribonucleotide reductase beta subunit family protein with ferritin-like domain
MSKTIFNRNEVDWSKEPMFFGEDLSVQRYDVFKYPQFDKLNQTMLGYFWRPEEVSLQKDRSDFAGFRPEQKHIFTSNLKYQTLLDSVQGRGPSLNFLPYCSNPELEGCIVTWDFFETIHSRAYTHIMKNVYSDPSEVFDTILNDKEITKRAVSVTENYDKFGELALQYTVNRKGSVEELKRQLYLAMVNVNLLEGLRFYVSFACTFAFGELKLMEGSAKLLSLIARDEATHLNLTTHVIKAWQKGDDKDILKIIKQEDKTVIEMFKKCVEEEKAWARHLFRDGSIIGLNERLLGQYVEHIANKRLKALGYDAEFDTPATQNPLPWTSHWLSSRGEQIAPQETEITSYIVGGIKQDIKKETFSKFKL